SVLRTGVTELLCEPPALHMRGRALAHEDRQPRCERRQQEATPPYPLSGGKSSAVVAVPDLLQVVRTPQRAAAVGASHRTGNCDRAATPQALERMVHGSRAPYRRQTSSDGDRGDLWSVRRLIAY